MSIDSTSTPVPALPTPPADMVEWSRKAANLLRAVARAYPHGAPAEVQTNADEIWKLASRSATLAGVLESQSKAVEKLTVSGGKLRAAIEQQVEALVGEDSAESRTRIEQLRGDLDRFDKALSEDLRTGRQNIETRVREALACEKSLTETTEILMKHLRAKPECRELLEDIAK